MESKFAGSMLRVLAALFALLGGLIVLTGTLLFATPFLIGPGAELDFTDTWINASLFGFNILQYPWPAHPTVLQLWGIPALAMLKLWGLGLALGLCVAGMFARGCELQRQADETL